MSIYGANIGIACGGQTNCLDKFGCGECPDFTIKRHDTKPEFKVLIEDCSGFVDFNDESYAVEVNMWAKARIKTAITSDDEYFALADNIGFEQMMVDDIIVVDRIRLPERMRVLGFDETHRLVKVLRGIQGTDPGNYSKGMAIRIFRTVNATAQWQMDYEDVIQADGTTKNELTGSFLVYNWNSRDTCLPGCYVLEFKLMKMLPPVTDMRIDGGGEYRIVHDMPSISEITFTSEALEPESFGCGIPADVDWIRRYPADREGFLIKIIDSPTVEM